MLVVAGQAAQLRDQERQEQHQLRGEGLEVVVEREGLTEVQEEHLEEVVVVEQEVRVHQVLEEPERVGKLGFLSGSYMCVQVTRRTMNWIDRLLTLYLRAITLMDKPAALSVRIASTSCSVSLALWCREPRIPLPLACLSG